MATQIEVLSLYDELLLMQQCLRLQELFLLGNMLLYNVIKIVSYEEFERLVQLILTSLMITEQSLKTNYSMIWPIPITCNLQSLIKMATHNVINLIITS